MKSGLKKQMVAIICIAACAYPAWTLAQNVYKCADGSYSQAACAGGTALPSDRQTPAQMAAARANAQRDGKAADAMEKARLAQEARAASATPVAPKTPASAPASAPAGKPKRKSAKKTDDKLFVAVVPGSGKKAAKKKTKKST